MKENFEVKPHNQNSTFIEVVMLTLYEANNITEKWSGKWSTIHLKSIWFFKIVFILLTKIIAVYKEFFYICFLRFSLDKIFLEISLYLKVLQKWFYELFEKVINLKKSLNKIEVLEKIKTLLLPVLNLFALFLISRSSIYSLGKLAWKLT